MKICRFSSNFYRYLTNQKSCNSFVSQKSSLRKQNYISYQDTPLQWVVGPQSTYVPTVCSFSPLGQSSRLLDIQMQCLCLHFPFSGVVLCFQKKSHSMIYILFDELLCGLFRSQFGKMQSRYLFSYRRFLFLIVCLKGITVSYKTVCKFLMNMCLNTSARAGKYTGFLPLSKIRAKKKKNIYG